MLTRIAVLWRMLVVPLNAPRRPLHEHLFKRRRCAARIEEPPLKTSTVPEQPYPPLRDAANAVPSGDG